MREIKFRAWDIKYKKMLNWDFLETQQGTYLNSKYFIPMLYTWLEDKNKQEIYEGDFVKLYNMKELFTVNICAELGVVADYYNKKKREGFRINLYKQIVFDGPSISIDINGKVTGEEWYTKRRAEVIGNIYENPELLKI